MDLVTYGLLNGKINQTAAQIQQEVQDTTNLLAPVYSNQLTYKKGDVVLYQNQLYKSNTGIGTPEDFDNTKWDAGTVADFFSDGGSATPGVILGNGGVTGTDKWMPVAEIIILNADPINKPVGYWVHKDLQGNETLYPFDYDHPYQAILSCCCANIDNGRDNIGLRKPDGETWYTMSVNKQEKWNGTLSFNSSTGYLENLQLAKWYETAFVKINLS